MVEGWHLLSSPRMQGEIISLLSRAAISAARHGLTLLSAPALHGRRKHILMSGQELQRFLGAELPFLPSRPSLSPSIHSSVTHLTEVAPFPAPRGTGRTDLADEASMSASREDSQRQTKGVFAQHRF